jgi:hypothetical protein
MTFSLGQSLFKLPENGGDRAAFSLEEPQLVPKADYFSLFCGVHDVHSAFKPNVNEKRTKLKQLGFGPATKASTRILMSSQKTSRFGVGTIASRSS